MDKPEITDKDIATTEGAIEAIKTAVANDDDEVLAGILFTRQLWAYDRGLKERTEQVLKIIHNDLTGMKRNVRKEMKKKKSDTRVVAQQKRQSMRAILEVIGACQSMLSEHIKLVQYASDTFVQLYGSDGHEEE